MVSNSFGPQAGKMAKIFYINIKDADSAQGYFFNNKRKAQEKGTFLNGNANLIIKSAHPSPYSAANGFFDSKPFSKTNEYLDENGISSINWEL